MAKTKARAKAKTAKKTKRSSKGSSMEALVWGKSITKKGPKRPKGTYSNLDRALGT